MTKPIIKIIPIIIVIIKNQVVCQNLGLTIILSSKGFLVHTPSLFEALTNKIYTPRGED